MTDSGHEEKNEQAPRTSRTRDLLLSATAAAAFFLVAGLIILTTSGSDATSGRHAVAGEVATPIVMTVAPAPAPSANVVLEAATEPPTDTPKPATAPPTPTQTVALTATPSAVLLPPTPVPTPIASSIAASPILDDGGAVSVTPVPDADTPPPLSGLTANTQALATSIQTAYGVRVLNAGQDWGADEPTQVRNLTSLQSALAGIPARVRSRINQNGSLTFLSNHTGQTEGGWSPYGKREANYYTNEDQSPDGYVQVNEIILQPGSTSQTIAHEIMHAYQMRDIAPGQYALALLTPEMKSFMAATGWTQTGTDEQVRQAAESGWDAVNALFTYHGRILAYNNQFGDGVGLYTPNPLEAYAEAGGLYYGHAEHLTLPDWPEYWNWLATNIGQPAS